MHPAHALQHACCHRWDMGHLLHLLQVGPSPDVWQQLLELCTAEPDGQPTALPHVGNS
jgi:hypothetical protein